MENVHTTQKNNNMSNHTAGAEVHKKQHMLEYLISKFKASYYSEYKVRNQNFYWRALSMSRRDLDEVERLKKLSGLFIEPHRREVQTATKYVLSRPMAQEMKPTKHFDYEFNQQYYTGPVMEYINFGTYPESTFKMRKDVRITQCLHCGATETSLWRKLGSSVVCNACGLYFKMHGVRRPASLKKSVIKKRKRSRRMLEDDNTIFN